MIGQPMGKTMKRVCMAMLAMVVFCAVSSVSTSSAGENPYGLPLPILDAKEGEWVMYNLPTIQKEEIPGFVIQRRDTVVGVKTEDGVKKFTIKSEMLMQGLPKDDGETWDQTGTEWLDLIKEIEADPSGELSIDKETITIRAKPMECTVLTVTMDKGTPEEAWMKIYFSDEIPVTGIARIDDSSSSEPSEVANNFGWEAQ